MIITCAHCKTNFLIKPEQLGEKGKKVRCGNCAEVWLQAPQAPEEAAKVKEVAVAQAENLKKAVKEKAAGVEPTLPTVYEKVQPPKKLKTAVYALVMINAFTFLFVGKNIIGQTGFYDSIGQYNTEGMEITSFSIKESEEREGVKVHKVNWAVKNNSSEERELPVRTMRLLDEDMKVLVDGNDDSPVRIKPGETKDFKDNSIKNANDKGKYLVLEIGNPHELAIR